MRINGLEVHDARSAIVLQITPRDAMSGRKQPERCAAARAAMRDVPNCLAARIHLGRCYIKTEGKWLRYYTSDALRCEIIAFDRGGRFQPGEYTLLPVPPSMTMAAIRKRAGSNTNRNKSGSSPKKSPRKLHVVQGVRPRKASRGEES